MSDHLEYTHPDVFRKGVKEGWADPETDPTKIDWAARQARAVIPFRVVGGRPVTPGPKTLFRYGRNEFGHWGEKLAADALVFVTTSVGRRFVAMVEREDGHGWAIPGGCVDEGEDFRQAAIRELFEETGLQLPDAGWKAGEPRVVPDPRGSDEAWMTATPFTVDLGVRAWGQIPPVVGGDDAIRASWVRADSFEELLRDLAVTYGERLFPAHAEMLLEALGPGDWKAGDVVIDAAGWFWQRAHDDSVRDGWPWRGGVESISHKLSGGREETAPARPLALLARDGRMVPQVSKALDCGQWAAKIVP